LYNGKDSSDIATHREKSNVEEIASAETFTNPFTSIISKASELPPRDP